ncbi:MAG: EAL domain-containing protein [Bacillota bacterium]
MQEDTLSNWATTNLSLKRKLIYGTIIGLMLPLVYWFVYATGGIKYVYSHSMYIPILLAGILFGLKGGLLVGLVAGIILGPLMPISVVTNETQPLVNWLFRLLIFAGTGALSGYGVDRIKKRGETIRRMILYNAETAIPNTNAIKALCKRLPKGPKTIVTVLITNHQDVIDALGTDVYNRILYGLYKEIRYSDLNIQVVVQGDTHKLWIVKEHRKLEKDANALLTLITSSQSIDGTPTYLDVSLGLSVIKDEDACDTLESYRVSDSLARQAQENNLPYAIKDNELNQKIKEYDLIARFNESFYNDELSLVFQTQVEISSGKPFAVEALLRWAHPKLGRVSPSEFIPLIEKTKLIHPLTNWVIENALKAIKTFEKHNVNLDVSINISAKNLYDPDFYERTVKIIDKIDVNPEKVIFEITESALMIEPKKSHGILDRFVKLGIRISIDDFGAGYSSLAYLSRFPIHSIKIDRYFISQVAKDDSMMRIVKSTINLAHELGYEVISEGVEDEASSQILQKLKGIYAQGFYYATPKPLDELIQTFDTE